MLLNKCIWFCKSSQASQVYVFFEIWICEIRPVILLDCAILLQGLNNRLSATMLISARFRARPYCSRLVVVMSIERRVNSDSYDSNITNHDFVHTTLRSQHVPELCARV